MSLLLLFGGTPPVTKTGTDSGTGTETSAVVVVVVKTGAETGAGTDTYSVEKNVAKAGTDTGTGTDSGVREKVAAFGTDSGVGTDTGVLVTTYVYTTPIEADATMSATIRQATPAATDVDSETIRIDNTTSAQQKALLRVPLTIPTGVNATVLRGELYLYKSAAWTGSATLTATAIDESWDAETVTWATVPTTRAETGTVTVATAGASGDEVVVNITTMLQAAAAAEDASGSRWYGVILSDGLTGDNGFYSEAASTPAYRPFVKAEWSIPPSAPTNPLPSGGRAVSETLPSLAAQFHDADAEDTCSAMQVEVSTENVFDTPVYISGKATTTSPLFDLNSPPTGANITLATSAAADDIIDTSAAHGLAAGDRVVFTSLTGGSGLTANTVYYVISANLASTTFQVSATDGGTAVNFTTDITAGSTAPVALTPGTTYYWRSRVWDNHGIVGEWSEAAEFVVTAKGTLTVASLGGTIATPTPLTSWTFTPAGTETQESVEVEYEIKDSGAWRQHYLYPRTVTAATSHQLPDANRLSEGSTYRRTVRLWDSIDREDTASDRAFLENQQEFTLTALVVP